MYKLMKIKDLKNYGIPSYVVNIWEKTKKGVCNTPLQEGQITAFAGNWKKKRKG